MTQINKFTPKPIKERTFNFAVNIVKFSALLKEEKQFEIANQLIKSGTSIGANMREASNGFSKQDFIYKVNIAQKEADETIYWLEIIMEVSKYDQEANILLEEAKQLLKILRSISLNAKEKEKLIIHNS